MSYKLKNYNFTGFDISEKLIEAAITLNKNKSVKFLVGDFNSIEFNKKFNFITASGVLSVFQEFEAPLKKWLSWLTEDGYLFMAGRFNSRNIDTQILFRNNLNQNPKWEGGLSAYSINTISNFIKNLGFKCEFKKFNLPIEIKEDINNPIRTFTKELKNGEKIVMDGANIVAEHYLVKIGEILKINYCTKCILPDTRPNINFNYKTSTCDACLNKENKKKIDWTYRKKLLPI